MIVLCEWGEKMSEGDVSEDIEVGREDEMGKVGERFKEM